MYLAETMEQDKSDEKEEDKDRIKNETGTGSGSGMCKHTRGGTITKAQYRVFVQYLGAQNKPSLVELRDVDLIDSPSNSNSKASKNGYGVSGRFKAWAKKMTLREDDSALLFKKTGKEILCREEFDPVVRKLNKSPLGTHFSFAITLKKIREKYTTGKRQFGMSEDIVREILFTCTSPKCPCKKVKKLLKEEVTPKPVRASKSCSSLADKKNSSPTSSKSPQGDKGKLPETIAEKTKKAFTETLLKPKPPVAFYALLDLSSIANLHSTSTNTSEEGKDKAKTRFISGSGNATNSNQLDPGLLPQLSYTSSSGHAASFSLLPANSTASSAILNQLATGISGSQSVSSAVRPAVNSSKHPMLYRIVPNQSDSSSLAQELSTGYPNSIMPCVGRQLSAQSSADVGQGHSTDTDATPLISGSRPSVKSSDLLDLEALTSFPMFEDSPMINAGPSQSLGISQPKHHQGLSESGGQPCTFQGAKTSKKQAFPSFNAPSDGMLPYQELWFYKKDILHERNRFRRLVQVINDMRLDVRQSLMGMKPATERLRKKVVVAASLLGRCKEITIGRKKIAAEKKKAKNVAAMRAAAAIASKELTKEVS